MEPMQELNGAGTPKETTATQLSKSIFSVL